MPYETDFWSYAGASAGRSSYGIACTGPGACDHMGTGFRLFAGGRFNNYLGGELSYLHLGNVELGAAGASRAHGANATLLAGLTLGYAAMVNAKIGTTYGWTRFASGEESGFGLSYGANLMFNVSPNIDMRLDWDRYRFDFLGLGEKYVSLYSIGMQYRFH